MNHQNFSKMLYDLPQIALISSSNCNTMPLLQLQLQTAFMYSCSCHIQCCTSIVVRVVCRILLKFLDFFFLREKKTLVVSFGWSSQMGIDGYLIVYTDGIHFKFFFTVTLTSSNHYILFYKLSQCSSLECVYAIAFK